MGPSDSVDWVNFDPVAAKDDVEGVSSQYVFSFQETHFGKTIPNNALFKSENEVQDFCIHLTGQRAHMSKIQGIQMVRLKFLNTINLVGSTCHTNR